MDPELQRDLDQLHAMAEKLAAGKVEIVVFGEIRTGKSALINALVGEAVAADAGIDVGPARAHDQHVGAGCNEGREVAALCIYHDQDCDGRLLVDLMRTHRRVLINNAILESPYFEPPDQHRDRRDI